MKTLVYDVDDIPILCQLLSQDDLVAFPTETVFGLGANAYSDRACEKIYLAKGRPTDNPFIVHIACLDQIEKVAQNIPPIAIELFEHFSPGPLTIILPKSPQISSIATAGLSTVGVRIPSSPLAQKLLSACPFPLAAPSANRSGRPSPTTSDMVYQEMQGRIHAILAGPNAQVGLESTVISCLDDGIRLLRPGSISLTQLQEFLSPKGLEIHHPTGQKIIQSPGTHHPHYRPNYQIVLFERENLNSLLSEAPGQLTGLILLGPDIKESLSTHWSVKKFSSVEDFARQLYQALVEFENLACKQVLIELPPHGGIGDALRDRLFRAASKE